jgi:alkanesulfonate monooxygenase SsuD/methylene tetrahydromethanopterin reductase-like flavin-dependent oxidoreductase (luciferase family)
VYPRESLNLNPIAADGAMGLNALFWIPPTDSLIPRFEMFRDAASEAEGRELALGERCGVLRDMFVTDTMKEAEELAGEHIIKYMEWVCHFGGLSNHAYPGEKIPETEDKLEMLNYDFLHPRNMLFGTPEFVAEKIHELKEKLNLDRLLLWSSFPGIDHGPALNSIAGFTEKVLPLFSENPIQVAAERPHAAQTNGAPTQ